MLKNKSDKFYQCSITKIKSKMFWNYLNEIKVKIIIIGLTTDSTLINYEF